MTENKIKNTKDYSNGKIYIIRNSVDDRTYVGSTCQSLSQRMAQHRAELNLKKNASSKIYKAFKEIGKYYFFIELLEEYKCENNDQLRKRESELTREYKAYLNTKIETRTRKEQYYDNQEELAEKNKQKYQRNKDKLKEYYEANKDKISMHRKELREVNKEAYNASQRVYRKLNPERAKIYYEANKDKIKEHNREYRKLKKEN